MSEEAIIKKVSVEVKVIRIGGHKMTKATYHQIPMKTLVPIPSYFGPYERLEDGEVYAPETEYFLGWVNDSGSEISIFTDEKGGLFRASIRNWRELDSENNWVYLKDSLDQIYIAT